MFTNSAAVSKLKRSRVSILTYIDNGGRRHEKEAIGCNYTVSDHGGLSLRAGEWYQRSCGRERGIVSANGGRYFLNLNGIVQKSRWLNVGGKKYYALWNGRLKTGLLKKDGKEYFFGDDGALVTNAKVQAGRTTRYADRNGVLR